MRALRLREGGREGKTEDSANKGGGGAKEGNRIPAGPGFPPMSEENWVGVEVWWMFPISFLLSAHLSASFGIQEKLGGRAERHIVWCPLELPGLFVPSPLSVNPKEFSGWIMNFGSG